jgi:uncharacterized protein YlzI (FlbEa/FlbD family)
MILNYVRSFFVVDCNTGLLYNFKKLSQNNPSKILHLNGGVITEGEQHFEDPGSKQHIPSFELLLNGKKYQIVPEHAEDFDTMVKEFKKMVRIPKLKKQYGKKMVNGSVTVLKTPWKLVSKYSSIVLILIKFKC